MSHKFYTSKGDTQDSCPICGSNDVQFHDYDNVDYENGFYEATCPDCGFQGRQWHKMTFDGWQTLTDEGTFEDMDFIPSQERA